MRDVSFSVVSESRQVLLTQAELLNDSTITLNVLALEERFEFAHEEPSVI